MLVCWPPVTMSEMTDLIWTLNKVPKGSRMGQKRDFHGG